METRHLSKASSKEMSRLVQKPTMWFPTRSDTNRAVQAQKMAGDGKFWIKKVEESNYPCSENKGADQLRSYCEADLRLCFRLCRLLVFPWGGSNGDDWERNLGSFKVVTGHLSQQCERCLIYHFNKL